LRRRFMIRPHGATTLGDAVRVLAEDDPDAEAFRYTADGCAAGSIATRAELDARAGMVAEVLADSATLRAVIGTISEGLERP